VTNGKPSDLRPGSREWRLAVRACGYLIARDGRVPVVKLRRIARELGFAGSLPPRGDGRCRGSTAAAAVYRVVRALDGLDLARRSEGDRSMLVAVDLTAVAVWLADELEGEREFQEAQAVSG
jgi:hypothetical protein